MKYFFFFIISFSSHFSWSDPLELHKKIIQQNKEQIRLLNYPDINLGQSYSAYLAAQNQDASVESFTKYCVLEIDKYVKLLENRLQLSGLQKMFFNQCLGIISQFRMSPVGLPSEERITLTLQSAMDRAYIDLITLPSLTELQTLNKIESAYKGSILGMMGVEIQRSFLIQQLVSIAALLISVAVIVIRLV